MLDEFVTLQERCGTVSLPGWCSLRVTGGSYYSAPGLLDRLRALSIWSCQDSPGGPGGMQTWNVELYLSPSQSASSFSPLVTVGH